MSRHIELLKALLPGAELAQGDDDHVYGIYGGYPIGLSLLACGGLMVHVRHPQRGDALPSPLQYHWRDPLAKLVSDNRARVTVEDGIAWLEIYNFGRVVDEGPQDIVNAWLEGLLGAGIGNTNLCHVCGRNPVSAVRFAEKRVVQICDRCLDGGRMDNRSGGQSATGLSALVAESEPTKPGSFVVATAFAVCGAALGAGLWAGTWLGFDALLNWIYGGRGVENVRMPIEVALLLGALGLPVGAAVGLPIGFLGRCSRRPAICLAAVGTLAALFVGEVLYATCKVYQMYGVFLPAVGLRVLGLVWESFGLVLIVGRIIAIAAALGVGIHLATLNRKRSRLAA